MDLLGLILLLFTCAVFATEHPDSSADSRDNFAFHNSDGADSLRVTGQLQSDYRMSQTQTSDGFLLRRARFGLEATLQNIYDFRFMPDFGMGQSRIQDGYINIHPGPAAQLTIGKFKQPMSFEELIPDRFVPVMERSLLDQLVPARDLGIMVHGQRVLGALDYALSLSNGGLCGITASGVPADMNFDGNVDVNGRVVYHLLPSVQMGVSATYGSEAGTVMPFSLRTPAGIPFDQFRSGIQQAGLRKRVMPEFAVFSGGLGFVAQYFYLEQEFAPAPSSSSRIPLIGGGYLLMATYFLTGETRHDYDEWFNPIRPFSLSSPLRSPGALEAVARISHLEFSDHCFDSLSDSSQFSRLATEITLGLNWYLTRFVRAQFNFEHSWFDSVVEAQNALLGRLQIIF